MLSIKWITHRKQPLKPSTFYAGVMAIIFLLNPGSVAADESAFINKILTRLEKDSCSSGITNSDVAYGTEVPIGAFLLQKGQAYDAYVDIQYVELLPGEIQVQAEYRGANSATQADWSRDQLLFVAAFSPFFILNNTGYTKNGQVFRVELNHANNILERLYIAVETNDRSAFKEDVILEFAPFVLGDGIYSRAMPASASGIILNCVNIPSVFVEAKSGSYHFQGNVDLTVRTPTITLSN